MSEAEWLECGNPERLFSVVEDRGGTSDRKLRLLACACVRRIWAVFPTDPCREAVVLAERHADGLADWEVLEPACIAAKDSRLEPDWEPPDVVAAELALSALEQLTGHTDPWECVRGASEYARDAAGGTDGPEWEHQCRLLRDIFGNPYRTVSVDPACRTPTAVSLAQAAYEERTLPSGELEPARLAVLADALEEAGCTDADILAHLRSPGPHVRGCWALDLVLGKE